MTVNTVALRDLVAEGILSREQHVRIKAALGVKAEEPFHCPICAVHGWGASNFAIPGRKRAEEAALEGEGNV